SNPLPPSPIPPKKPEILRLPPISPKKREVLTLPSIKSLFTSDKLGRQLPLHLPPPVAITPVAPNPAGVICISQANIIPPPIGVAIPIKRFVLEEEGKQSNAQIHGGPYWLVMRRRSPETCDSQFFIIISSDISKSPKERCFFGSDWKIEALSVRNFPLRYTWEMSDTTWHAAEGRGPQNFPDPHPPTFQLRNQKKIRIDFSSELQESPVEPSDMGHSAQSAVSRSFAAQDWNHAVPNISFHRKL
ncbi:hypothetical protein P7C70_g4090, partial [Phenoliferia sp. Uapishka_3]